MEIMNNLIIQLESFITLHGTTGVLVLALGLGLIVSICATGMGRK